MPEVRREEDVGYAGILSWIHEEERRLADECEDVAACSRHREGSEPHGESAEGLGNSGRNPNDRHEEKGTTRSERGKEILVAPSSQMKIQDRGVEVWLELVTDSLLPFNGQPAFLPFAATCMRGIFFLLSPPVN